MRKELTLFLGLRLHEGGSGTLRTVEALLEEISSLEPHARIPLHWNLPLYPLFAGSSRPLNNLITEIKARVKTRGDVLAPAGFRGAVHPFLDDHELERELAWCRRNPWLPGFRELLGQDPEVTVPFVPDLAREAAAGMYSAAGFRLVGLPFRLAGSGGARKRRRRGCEAAAAAERFLLLRQPERAAVVSASILPLSQLDEDSAVLAMLAARAPENLLLLLDLPPEARREPSAGGGPSFALDRPISRLIEALSYRHSLNPAGLSLTALSDLQPQTSDAGATESFPKPLPLASLIHQSEACPILEAEGGLFPNPGLSQARAFRHHGRRRNEDTRKALELLVPDWNPATDAAPSARPRGGLGAGRPSQILFAEMSGTVSLPGPEFAAHFADGRLRGISRGGTEIAGGAPAECSFVFAGRRIDLRTVSAASFERDGDHGLATTFAARLSPADGEIQVLVEAYFREGVADLCLDCSVRFPAQAPALQAGTPYEIPLFRFAERLTPELETELDSGALYREKISPCEGYLMTCGRGVRVSLGGAAVVLAGGGCLGGAGADDSPGAPAVTVLPLRVRRESGMWALRACLAGRTCPLLPLPVGGSISHVSFRLGIRGA